MSFWTQEDVEDFIRRTKPPGEQMKGFDDGILFIDALAIATDPISNGGETTPLEVLRKKYPEAVEDYMEEAKRRVSLTPHPELA